MSSGPEHPALEELRLRLEQEEEAYAEVLAALDRLAASTPPAEAAPELHEKLAQLNALWSAPQPPSGGGPGGWLRRRAWDALAPAIERQTSFNATLVQLLNVRFEQADRLHARLRELVSALVRYAQRVQPLVDARARLASALATTHSELVLESFGRQLEAQGRRLGELVALRDRLEALAGGPAVSPAAGTASPPPSTGKR